MSRTALRRRLLPLLPILLVLAAGCSTSSSAKPPASRASAPGTASLQRAAGLQPCPAAGPRRGPLPDVTLTCLGDGRPVRVGHLRGPLLVSIWASWCQPCYREMPVLQQLHARAGGRLPVLGVDTSDTNSRGLQALTDTGVHYPSVADPHRRVAAALGITTQPTTVFVRADGTVADVLRTPVTSLADLLLLVRQQLGVQL